MTFEGGDFDEQTHIYGKCKVSTRFGGHTCTAHVGVYYDDFTTQDLCFSLNMGSYLKLCLCTRG